MLFTNEELKFLQEERNAKIRIQNEKVRKENERIANGLNYSIELYYIESQENGSRFEEIEMEGFVNAEKIFSTYRKMGHTLRLAKINLSLDDKKVFAVNFKYSDGSEKKF